MNDMRNSMDEKSTKELADESLGVFIRFALFFSAVNAGFIFMAMCFAKGMGMFHPLSIAVDLMVTFIVGHFTQRLIYLYSLGKKLREKNVDYKILFLDATDEELVRRYRANRRKHPLCIDETVSLEDAVSIERAKLAIIREMSDFVIDTSELTTYALKSRVSETLFGNSREGFTVVCKSFGFKHGIDTEADLMFDVRCLPNPFYVEDLKKKNGLQKEVTDYIFSFKETKKFAKELLEFIKCALPLYVKEGKSQLVISMGCTGGKHRSVAFAELIYRELIEEGYNAKTLHRDIEK